MEKNKNKLGIVLAGLGSYSKGQLAPALKETNYCYLSGIVTGSSDKASEWQKKYHLKDENIYNYENFDSIKDNTDIDIIYVVLPNSMHAEYAIRAARAGKHVICEKPMAITVEDCDKMIAACKEAGVMLSIGYRLHFEPFNKEMMRIGNENILGKPTKIFADNGMKEVKGWRINKELSGGGPLMDVGIYCVQGCRYTLGEEPIAVTAQEGEKKDKEKFAGLKGKTSDGIMNFSQVNQQAKQMDDFALAIMEGRPTPVPGEMGRQDVKILQAIYKAMETGKRVEV